MAKKEILTDLWVYELLKEADVPLSPQGSFINELDNALKTASKAGTGKVGYPEYCGIVKDFIIVIENKADVSFHVKRTEKDVISNDITSIKKYAVNGALFYGKHLISNTTYKKVIAIGVSGNEKRHQISPIFIDERGGYKELEAVETFTLFNTKNIEEYYIKNILKEQTSEEKTTEEILKDAKILHDDLRNYGSIQDKDKPLVVSGILLALREMEFKGFSIDSLTGDDSTTDGEKIYEAVEKNLKRSNVSPQVKKDKLLSQFLVIKDTKPINEKNEVLGKTPLKHYTEFIYENIYKNIKYIQSSEDYLGRFYGEFMSYSGGDGQNLGIVLTPKHITELFCELAELKPTDLILDPCCGTAGFLIAAMHEMLQKTAKEDVRRQIRKNQLHGLELQPYMFTIATTNMILRGDGKSNLEQEDFLKQNPALLQEKGCTVGMMNPPYSMGSKNNPLLYELNFTEHLLNSVVEDGRVIVIVPQSSMTNKTNEEQAIKENILKHHTLEGVITLNKNTFYGVGVNPCIVVFTAGIPHDKNKIVKFVNYENDGFEVQKHRGLVETINAKDKKQHLLDVWNNRLEAETKFCVQTTVETEDEWLHSFYYFNDEPPAPIDFEKIIGNYLTFEFNMIMQGKQHLFKDEELSIPKRIASLRMAPKPALIEEKKWKEFKLTDIFTQIQRGKRLKKDDHIIGAKPYASSTSLNNGIDGFIGNKESVRIFSNCLTLANSGSVGSTFYQPFEVIASDHVTKLENRAFNKHIYLFIATLVERLSKKYSFNREINDTRIKKEKILLPINEYDNPDYEFMECYMKYIEYNKLINYIQ
jgi:type I restriction enzyme M protein